MALHYGQDEFSDARQLAKTLGRKRLKDTSLDYGPADDVVRRYAERRGLAPESEIIVRAPEREAETPAARSRFAGLKLRAGRASAEAPQKPVASTTVTPEPVRTRTLEEIAREEQLRRGWRPTPRLGRTRPDGTRRVAQAEALARIRQALEALAPTLLRDARAVLERAPELGQGTGTAAGLAARGARARGDPGVGRTGTGVCGRRQGAGPSRRARGGRARSTGR